MADRVGQQFGNYQLVRLLGEGGFAEVYLGEHIHLGTQAAIKVLHTRLTSEEMDKFRTEARTIARLIHPNIVRVLEFGMEGKTPFLVMDFAPNGTLRQKHSKGVPLPLLTIVGYVKQVADALQYAHNEKLIHRDIKPENMVLGRHNEVLLSDFGIALVAQSSHYQSTQDMAGTMAYMSPEQIQGKPRPASDQYSLGVVVYEWLSGDRPFHGSFTELVGQHLSVPPPPLSSKVPTILPDVERVVMSTLAKDPKDRFLNVQAFARAIEQASQPVVNTFLKPYAPVIQQPHITTLRDQWQSLDVAVTPPSQPPIELAGITPPNQQLPPSVAVTPSSQPPPLQPSLGTDTSGGQQPWQMRSTGEIAQPLPSKRNPQIGLIIGTFFLLAILIGSGIFFFSRNMGNPVSSNLGNTSGSNSGIIADGKGCKKIGVLLPETATSVRWDSYDRPLLQRLITQALPGTTVDYANAQGNADQQQTQADTALARGDCILVVAASDSVKAAQIVAHAKADVVPVIAYDRLIQSNDLAYYVSFDDVMVGALQGQYIVDHYRKFVQGGNANVVMINGSQTDNNALLFAQGVHTKLDPLFQSGALKNVYEKFTPNWDNPTAQTEMEAALTANSNNIQIAYVANDGMAVSVIAALKAQNLNGKVLVTGQDATIAGIHSILAGDQTMTIYKAIAKEAQATADLIKLLVDGSNTSSLTNGATVKTSDGIPIPSVFVPPVVVDKSNIATTVIADGYITKADVCQGIPAGTDSVC